MIFLSLFLLYSLNLITATRNTTEGPSKEEPKMNTMIIAAIAGGFILIIVVILLVVFIVILPRRRKKKAYKRREAQVLEVLPKLKLTRTIEEPEVHSVERITQWSDREKEKEKASAKNEDKNSKQLGLPPMVRIEKISGFLFFLLLVDLAGTEFSLDWSKCNLTDRACFVTREIPPVTTTVAPLGNLPNTIALPTFELKPYNSNEEVPKVRSGMQIRPYSETKWLVFLQSEGINLDHTDGLKLMDSSGKIIFGCKQPLNSKEVDYDTMDVLKSEKYYDYSRFEVKMMVCVFIVEGDALKTLPSVVKFMYKEKDKSKPEVFNGKDVHNLVKPRITCNPDEIVPDLSKEIGGFQDHVKEIIPDIVMKNFKCSTDKYLMVIPESKPNAVKVTDITCTANKYKYKSVAGESGTAKEVFCSVPIELSCQDRIPHIPTSSFLQYPSRIICPSDKWFINEELYIVGQPYCNRLSAQKPNSFEWFIRSNDNKEIKMEKAQCYEKIDCMKYSKLTNCALSNCSKVDITKDKVSCPFDHILRVKQSSGRFIHVSYLVCNGESGRWKGPKTSEEVEDGASAYCERNCEALSPLKDDCIDSKKCSNIFRNDQEITCPAAYSLRVESSQKIISPEKLTCNIANGRWKTTDNIEIEKGAKAYCEASSLTKSPSVFISLLPSIAVSSIVIIAVITAMAGLFLYMRKKNTKEAMGAVEVKKGGAISSMMAPPTTDIVR
ncbi:hypothetical protein PRIPAC_70787 [Pristionchus pacificus]|uniref:Uncharacterized protein n=1 Tax=Pristionchus pacificus TaxID=54126 RepID=A0A2A6CA68_PRIPA|nr:hypothetical protein PRIPAC_70787 [Pristionchus pacificus]|eukprot:PDM75074.1 hypothetical protein PRIPAC_40455 [Pristionchus pacificus]